MRKIALLAVAVALTAGTAAYSLACDQDKASSTSSASASCCAKTSKTSNTQLTSAGGDGSCSAHKSAAAGSACSAHKGSNANAVADGECKDGDYADAVFSIADIHGDCCVKGVQTAFSKVKGVRYVKVDVASKKAYVCTRGAKLDRKAALKSLKSAGYETASYMGTDKSYMMRDAAKTTKASPSSKV